MMEDEDFPERIQFWTRVGNDNFKQGKKRLDLQHPSFWWDKHASQNILVLPDAYMFSQWEIKTSERECMERNSASSGYFK